MFANSEMGIVLSVVITYAGMHEAVECLKHIIGGVIPDNQPGFDDLVEYYTRELRKANKTANNWITDYGQGYLSLTEDKSGNLKAAAVKYYQGHPDSTAILFSTKISSFGDSIDDTSSPTAEPTHQPNGDYRAERYSPSNTKTIALNTSGSYTVANRKKSPGADTRTPENSSEVNPEERRDTDKLTWQYTPIDTPEIHFQPYDDDKPGVFTEDYLRSLDGIKLRPLQRSDPSGRRRSFRKHRSSSSTSSKDSRASRDEELKIFTSLEEAEFKANGVDAAFGSAPNLSARSSSRSRSRERRHENTDGSVISLPEDVKLTDVPKLDSFDEKTEEKEVIEEEDDIDFWANSGD